MKAIDRLRPPDQTGCGGRSPCPFLMGQLMTEQRSPRLSVPSRSLGNPPDDPDLQSEPLAGARRLFRVHSLEPRIERKRLSFSRSAPRERDGSTRVRMTPNPSLPPYFRPPRERRVQIKPHGRFSGTILSAYWSLFGRGEREMRAVTQARAESIAGTTAYRMPSPRAWAARKRGRSERPPRSVMRGLGSISPEESAAIAARASSGV